jgi:hypothetical protein
MSERRLALVVAIDRYDDAALHQLAAPGADAEALAEVLGDPALGGFEVEVVRNPTSSALAERVERTLTERHPSDLVLLHFSGHGLKDDAGELHLAATNTVPGLLGSTAVDAAWVSRVMQRSRAQRVVLLLDCCYGGAFERGLIRRAGSDIDVGDQFSQRQLGEGRGRVVITASTAMEYAFEDAELADGASVHPSVFTSALVDGIRTGEADRNQDGQVSLGELYDFVYDRVRERTPNQTPSKWEFGLRGDLQVARNPHRRVRAAELAPELLDLVKHALPGGRRAAVRELAEIAAGPDRTRAAAARLHLRDLTQDDSRAVSAEATAALVETEVRLAADTLDLGSAAVGSTATGQVTMPPPRPVAAAVPARSEPNARSSPVALIAGAGVLLLVAALSIVAVLTNNTEQKEPKAKSSAAPSVPPSTTAQPASTMRAEYSVLLTMLPDPLRASCRDLTVTSGEAARASCGAGEYALWKTEADVKADFDYGASPKKGSCAKAPPDSHRIDATFPLEYRSGQLTCWYIPKDSETEAYYVIEWALYGPRVTGMFVSADGDPKKYPKLYADAVAALKAMP